MNSIGSAGCQSNSAKKIEKHLDLQYAVKQINQIISKAEDLNCRILGTPTCQADNCKSEASEMPLIGVLENLPNDIRSKCEKLLGVIDTIETNLFG